MECTTRDVGWTVCALLSLLLQHATEKEMQECVRQNNAVWKDAEFIEECIPALLFIREHARRKPSLKEIAALSFYSESHFQKRFSRAFSMSPHELCELVRLEYSKTLLLKNMRLRDVALTSGYMQANYYNRVFSRYYGISPRLWRRQEKSLIRR